VKRQAVLASILSALAVAALPSVASAAEPFASGCPKAAPEEGAAARLNHNPAAQKSIVPGGAVSVRLCRYWGFAGADGEQTPKSQNRAGSLRDQAELHGGDALESLILEFHELETVPEGTYNCPEDEGAVLYAVFGYARAKPVVVEVKLSGCEFVNNGRARTRALRESVRKKLERLLEGHRGSRAAQGGVNERRAVAFPPPRLSFAAAVTHLKAFVAEGCEVICTSWKLRHCTRKSAATVGCALVAIDQEGKTCHVGLSARKIPGEGLITSALGGGDPKEECFYLFAPPGLKEHFEEVEREEAEEAARQKPKHSD
jgi:hypothetical protein